MKEVSICAIDAEGGVIGEGKTTADPDAIVAWLMVRGSWAESVANNAEIAQSVVWLPVHMGNAGLSKEIDSIWEAGKPELNWLKYLAVES